MQGIKLDMGWRWAKIIQAIVHINKVDKLSWGSLAFWGYTYIQIYTEKLIDFYTGLFFILKNVFFTI